MKKKLQLDEKTVTVLNAREMSKVVGQGGEPPCPPVGYAYFPYPGDPSMFWMCINGTAFPKKCPEGLFWNTELETCDWPQYIHVRGI